jgi:hypothetical protein
MPKAAPFVWSHGIYFAGTVRPPGGNRRTNRGRMMGAILEAIDTLASVFELIEFFGSRRKRHGKKSQAAVEMTLTSRSKGGRGSNKLTGSKWYRRANKLPGKL